MSFILFYSFVSFLLLLTALMQSFLAAYNGKPVLLFALLCLSALLLFLPIEGQPLLYYLRGYTADLSITLTLYLLMLILQRGWDIELIRPTEKKYLMALVIIGACALYPLALGLAQFDSYRLGYDPQAFLVLLFFMGLFSWYKRMYFLAVLLTSSCLGFAFKVLESNNLWDYLLDPLISTMFLLIGLMSGLRIGAARIVKLRAR